MSGAVAEVLRLGTALLDGARAFDVQLGGDGLSIVSLLALAALTGAVAWRTSGWPADGASAPLPGGWAADAAMRGAAGGDDAMGVLQAETPGGGE
jgi:hypothetical protein